MKKKVVTAPTELEAAVISVLKGEQPLMGAGGVLTPLIHRAVEAALEAEMSSHLDSDDERSNRRNGHSRKTVKGISGAFELATPRDREGRFEPALVKKRQTVLTEGLDKVILQLYGLGSSYSDIKAHCEQMYGLEVSSATINAVTDRLLEDIADWRSRPLDSVYPILFLDAMHFKVREDGRVVAKALYSLLAVTQDGRKEILGLYVSDAEGAKFWLAVLADLKARGVEDILIACVDGLKGFPEAIESVFPKTTVQLCVIHQIRNSIRYVASKDQKAFMRDLKPVYKAINKDSAELALDELDRLWGSKYPAVIASWRDKWHLLSAYFKNPDAVRKPIYTTNAVEALNRTLRKIIKNRGSFPTDDSIYKLLYLALRKASKKWTMPIRNWNTAINRFAIEYEGRLTI